MLYSIFYLFHDLNDEFLCIMKKIILRFLKSEIDHNFLTLIWVGILGVRSEVGWDKTTPTLPLSKTR